MGTQVIIIIAVVIILFFMGVKIVRPTHRGLIERLGKYIKFAQPGFHWVIPFIDKMYVINTTEQMVDAQPQEIITNDNLNASVDAQVYFSFVGNAQLLRKLETVENALRSNAKIVIPTGTELVNVIGEMAGVLPINMNKDTTREREKLSNED